MSITTLAASLPAIPEADDFFAQIPPWFWRVGQAGQKFFIHLWFETRFGTVEIRIRDIDIAQACGQCLRWVQYAIRQLLDVKKDTDDKEPTPLISKRYQKGHREDAGRMIGVNRAFLGAKKEPHKPESTADPSPPAPSPVPAPIPDLPEMSDEARKVWEASRERRKAEGAKKAEAARLAQRRAPRTPGIVLADEPPKKSAEQQKADLEAFLAANAERIKAQTAPADPPDPEPRE